MGAGYSFSVALTSDGTAWALGYNAYGQIGDGTTTQRANPVQVSGLSVVGSTPERLKESNMISYDEFVLGYENGRARCSVSGLLTLRLFFADKIREKWVSISLLFWSLGFLALIAVSVIGFLNLSSPWELLGTIAMLAIYALAFFYSVGGFVLSAALANEEFYEFAKAKRALWIYSEDEEEANALAVAP